MVNLILKYVLCESDLELYALLSCVNEESLDDFYLTFDYRKDIKIRFDLGDVGRVIFYSDFAIFCRDNNEGYEFYDSYSYFHMNNLSLFRK